MALPVLAALHRDFREVHVACSRKHRVLAELAGPIARAWDVDGAETAWLHGGPAPVDYGLVVAFNSLVQVPGAEVRRVAARPPAGVPAWQHFASAYPCDPAWRPELARTPGPRPIVLMPGTAGSSKAWPLDRWHAVAAAAGESARLIGGPLEPWAQERPELPELVALLASAGAFAGPDSGPAHLAARLGCPAAVVVVSEESRAWLPLGAQAFERTAEPSEVAAWARAQRETELQKPGAISPPRGPGGDIALPRLEGR